jgi:SNF2 family DNA or RNA helicase
LTLKDVDVKPTYRSPRDNVAKCFYIPVMSECTRFDRAACYFSSKALSHYSEGLYYLGKRNKGCYRLLISLDLSEDDYRQIVDGYESNSRLDDLVKESMIDDLTLDDEVHLSNLSYLIGCGIVQVKFALIAGGLFHNKFGYVSDDLGNSISFTGSNNETAASIIKNFERFETTVSWLSGEYDMVKIHQADEDFTRLWEGKDESILVRDPPDVFYEQLEHHNRGRLSEFKEEMMEHDLALHLDVVDDALVLRIPSESDLTVHAAIHKSGLKSLIDHEIDNGLLFRKRLRSSEYRRVNTRLNKLAESYGLKLSCTDEVKTKYGSVTDMEAIAHLGSMIKSHNESIEHDFRIFEDVVNSMTERRLRDAQMRDSYFMYRMRRSANFSVPGAGKTAAVLGVYAYLAKTANLRKLVVVGPLNSFDSWIVEFGKTFGNKFDLDVFDSRDYTKSSRKIDDLRLNSGNKNLFLFNYEGLASVKSVLNDVIIDENTLLVYDEVHRVKNPDGKRAGDALDISGHSGYTIVMTGTPIPNSYADIYNFLHILYDEDYDDYFEYDLSILEDPTPSEIEQVNKKLQPLFCRTTKKQLGVPPVNYDEIIHVHATEQENELYAYLKANLSDALSFIIRTLQVESDPSMILQSIVGETEDEDFSGKDQSGMDLMVNDKVTAKTAKCIELVKCLTAQGKQIVVWCIFKRSMNNITSMLENSGIPCSKINGSVEVEDRKNILEDFRKGKTRVLVTNPHTLGESVSLHDVCHDAVYFEYSYNLVHLLQSKDRIHRLGLKEGQYTQYYYLQTMFDDIDMGISSLDEQIFNRLTEKEEIMINAIEGNRLESISTTKEDIRIILGHLGIDMGDIDE